nr:MAG TPA: hypothetical protein [Caudoviricetes sp.]
MYQAGIFASVIFLVMLVYNNKDFFSKPIDPERDRVSKILIALLGLVWGLCKDVPESYTYIRAVISIAFIVIPVYMLINFILMRVFK